jgi:hypothetical protein
MTNSGLSIGVVFLDEKYKGKDYADPPHYTRAALQVCVHTELGWGALVIRLKPIAGVGSVVNRELRRTCRRAGCLEVEAADSAIFRNATISEDIFVLEDEHMESVTTAHDSLGFYEGLTPSWQMTEPLYSQQ